MIDIRRMQNSEIERIAEIDRSEHITKNYINNNGSLELTDVDVQAPRWSPDDNNINSVRARIEEWGPILDDGGTMFGAFDDDVLVGFVIYRQNLSKDTAQLAVLHVSNNYRSQGIGALLTENVTQLAKADGAKKLYVSSTPTEPTVHFYMGQGFALTEEINQRLYELEPLDIHMIKIL